ncbi:25173_t:CDS:2, partial [Gigaspora margarita]
MRSQNSSRDSGTNDLNKPVQRYLNMVYLTFGGLCFLAATGAYIGLFLIKGGYIPPL